MHRNLLQFLTLFVDFYMLIIKKKIEAPARAGASITGKSIFRGNYIFESKPDLMLYLAAD